MSMVGSQGLFARQFADGLDFSGGLATTFWLRAGSDDIKGLGAKRELDTPSKKRCGKSREGTLWPP